MICRALAHRGVVGPTAHSNANHNKAVTNLLEREADVYVYVYVYVYEDVYVDVYVYV